MIQVPQAVWNEIAAQVPLTTEWAREMFPLDQAEATETLEDQAARMKAAGTPGKVILAYQTALPLWTERIAITDFIMKTGQSDLRKSLLEVTEREEAVRLAAKEHGLTMEQMQKLREMIMRLP
jgi:hypothetical protein